MPRASKVTGKLDMHEPLYSAYRFAGNQKDHVARFMFLYNILLQLKGDKQQQVDDFIRSELPSVPESPRPPEQNGNGLHALAEPSGSRAIRNYFGTDP